MENTVSELREKLVSAENASYKAKRELKRAEADAEATLGSITFLAGKAAGEGLGALNTAAEAAKRVLGEKTEKAKKEAEAAAAEEARIREEYDGAVRSVLREDYGLSDRVLDIVLGAAYEEGHSGGYEDVMSYAQEYAGFAAQIAETVLSENGTADGKSDRTKPGSRPR